MKFILFASILGSTICFSSTKYKSTAPIIQANLTTIDVPIYSTGLGHEKIDGFMENNVITQKTMKIMGMNI